MPQISRDEFDVLYSAHLPDNASGKITPEDVRIVFDNLSDSVIWHDESAKGVAGPSAYEVAVASGFMGTETEWLATLVGPEGPQGPAGEDGRTVRAVRIAPSVAFDASDADDGALIIAQTDATTILLQDEAKTPIRLGAVIHILQDCETAVGFIAAPGVTLDIYDGYMPLTRSRSSIASAVKIGANRWRVFGDLAAAPDTIPAANGGAVCNVRVESAVTAVIASEDVGGLLELSANDPVTVTLPADAAAAIPCGAVVHIAQAGAGSVEIVGEKGVTALVCGTKAQRISGQHGVVRAIKSAADTWRLTGDLADLRAFA